MTTPRITTESDLTRRAREVLAGLDDDACYDVARAAEHGLDASRDESDAAVALGLIYTPNASMSEVWEATPLGREVARLIAEGGR